MQKTFAQFTDETDIGPLFDSLFRALNLVVSVSGVAFIIMLVIAGLKYATSQGDPKGLQGAKDTLTLAIVGFLLVIGVFTLITILLNAFGLNEDLITPGGTLRGAFKSFIKLLNDCNRNPLACF